MRLPNDQLQEIQVDRNIPIPERAQYPWPDYEVWRFFLDSCSNSG